MVVNTDSGGSDMLFAIRAISVVRAQRKKSKLQLRLSEEVTSREFSDSQRRRRLRLSRSQVGMMALRNYLGE